MPQLYCYVAEEVAAQLQQKAERAHLSLSKYLALLIQKDIGTQWPDHYFDLFGAEEGETLKRPEQGDYEARNMDLLPLTTC